jgi:hypothetical protein
LILVLSLGASTGVLALVRMNYGLMCAWLSLKGLMGSVGASFLMAILFLLLSLVPLAMLLSLKARGKRAHQESRGGGRQVEAHP